LTDEVFYEAGKLKATNRISLADAIAIAEANVRDVELVTCDHHEFDDLVNEEKMVSLLDTVVGTLLYPLLRFQTLIKTDNNRIV